MSSVTETSIKDIEKNKRFFSVKSAMDELGITIRIKGSNR